MVLVEYHDPDGLFALVKPQLQARLPLRTLHWKSSSRPLRSIAAIHVDFVPSSSTQAISTDINGASNPSADTSVANRHSDPPARDSATILGVRAPQHKTHQRHQIPGLRDSSFLKVYLLKCDDKETYKTSARSKIREWMRESASHSAGGAGHDDHDAFEWLIIHVVSPDTPAALEARLSRSSGSDFEAPPAKSSSGTKWTGRKSSTILEKLRADFNQSTKHPPDRIAQIRLAKDLNSHDPTSRPAASDAFTAYDETAVAWNEIITKLKTLILLSFSSRVNQYEDDVRQRDAQRSLPGWNFCTFFVLKEGLGRAFESVGLFEDALAVYDELSAGLETTIEEYEHDTVGTKTNSFLPVSPDLGAIFSKDASQAAESLSLAKPIDEAARSYRDLIVSNNISVFDMKCYTFARQRTLLLRLAAPTAAVQGISGPLPGASADSGAQKEMHKDVRASGEIENALPLAALCERGTRFIISTSRLLRAELVSCQSSSLLPAGVSEKIVSAAVWSWTFAAARQILIETASPSFPAPPGSSFASSSPRDDLFPSRRTSLPPAALAKAPVTAAAIYEEDALHNVHDLSAVPHIKNTELSNAASHRAEIYMLQRRVLLKAAQLCGLSLKREDAEAKGDGNNDEEDIAPQEAGTDIELVLDKPLKMSLASEASLKNFYIVLSDHASWAYIISNRRKAAERLFVDMAIIKYCDGDFAKAAGYFNRLSTSYAKSSWQSIETSLLSMHAHCLRILNRKDEHMRVVMALLCKTVSSQAPSPKHKLRAMSPSIDAETLLHETIAFSKTLPYEFTVALDSYMRVLAIDKHITVADDRDGFRLSVTLGQAMVPALTVDKVKARLVDAEDGSLREIWLASCDAASIGASGSQVWLETTHSTFGSYLLDRISVHVGKITFVRDFSTRQEPATVLGRRSSPTAASAEAVKASPVLCYPRRHGLWTSAKLPSHAHLSKRKHVEIEIHSGSNEVHSSLLQVKASSAGLRLFNAEARKIGESDADAVTLLPSGQMALGAIATGSSTTLSIPWEVDKPASQIALRMEIVYSTSQGEFVFALSQALEVGLALDVTVQDLFKKDALMSQFLFKPIGTHPVNIMSAELQASETFQTIPSDASMVPMTASARDPVCMVYRIQRQRRTTPGMDSSGGGDKLSLTITYRPIFQDALEQSASKFQADVEASPFAELLLLLRRAFLETLERLLKKQNLEDALFYGEIALPSFEDVAWATVLRGLGLTRSASLERWLQDWHQSNGRLRLEGLEDAGYACTSQARQLVIDFEVPTLKYLHTAAVQLGARREEDASLAPVLAVGEAVVIEIRISHTRQWDSSTDRESVQFVYDVVADAATWLVAGQKRTLFTASEAEESTFEAYLIPLQAGQHALPSVEVQLAGRLEKAESAVICETDCITQCECVVVMEQSQSTTVGVGRGVDLKPGLALLDSDAMATAT